MNNLNEIIEKNIHGLYYGSRVLLPFSAVILKAVIESDIITDFSSHSKDALVTLTEDYTEIYFLEYKDIEESIKQFENIKLVLVEKGKDIFDFQNHEKIALYLEENHKLRIEKINDDILFIE
jgi:hypothetical protein